MFEQRSNKLGARFSSEFLVSCYRCSEAAALLNNSFEVMASSLVVHLLNSAARITAVARWMPCQESQEKLDVLLVPECFIKAATFSEVRRIHHEGIRMQKISVA